MPAVAPVIRVGSRGELTALGNTATDAGTVDAAASSDGRYLCVQTGAKGIVDEFRVGKDGSLTAIGSFVVPGAVGGEGIGAGRQTGGETVGVRVQGAVPTPP
ncbi:hypothetical protein [Streptomyces sp. NPDC088350]|uniref:hypothetical protein n=1 Tax=Streptomyces sp. NPDC088350 TaxID=3365854 RepID=UPI00382426E9